MIDGVACAFGGVEATVMQRRKQDSAAGGSCDEVIIGVMAARAMLALQVALASNP